MQENQATERIETLRSFIHGHTSHDAQGRRRDPYLQLRRSSHKTADASRDIEPPSTPR